MLSGKPSFPLPRDHFAHTKLTPQQATRFKAVVRAQLDAALRSERENVQGDKRRVDTTRWKLAKTKNELRIYKSRASALFRTHASSSASSVSPASASSRSVAAYGRAQPSMLSFGRMQGSLEDLIYGTYAATYDEMKTTCEYLKIDQGDCAVLHNLELATPEDPFHYLGLKWLYTPLPGSVVIKPRDWCFVNAMGIETDSEGKRFAYIITHSVDLVGCPPFDQRYVVRGQASLSFILRESSPGCIDLFAEGLYDPAGELIKHFSTLMTSEVLSGIFVTAKCAQAKKLTVMALRNSDLRSEVLAASSSSTSSTTSSKRACSYCNSSGSRFAPLRMCHVCCATACSKCRIKKSIFVGPNHSIVSVTCCQSCVLKATEMQVRPSEPQFSILGEKYVSLETAIACSSSDDDATSDSPEEATPMGEMDFVVETNGDGVECAVGELVEEGEDTTELSCMSEVEVERMIEAMMDQRLHDTKATSTIFEATATGSSDVESNVNPTDLELDCRATTAMAAVHDGTYATHIPIDEVKMLPPDQAAIYLQMLRLQNAAHHVYAITKANNELMMRSNTQ